MPLRVADKSVVLKVSIKELRHLYGHVNRNWLNLKTRTLGLIAGEVAMVSFVFSRFSVPTATYGRVFLGAGIALVSLTFIALLWVLATSSWKIPFDIATSKSIYRRFNNEQEFMEHLKEDYEDCISHCLPRFASRARVYNFSLIGFSIGLIILLVLKFK